jgi:hypothetical protein
MDPDPRTGAAIEKHWRASQSGQTETEHAIYARGCDPRLLQVVRTQGLVRPGQPAQLRFGDGAAVVVYLRDEIRGGAVGALGRGRRASLR